jgi:GNAT superfamily N-acetyltransferase
MQASSEGTSRADIWMRTGSPRDIDTLSDIDRDACVLFERAGLYLELSPDHEFSITERNRWLRCLAAGTVLIAVNRSGQDIGFAAVGVRDGEPFLDQLSVRLSFMGQGIGTQLLRASMKVGRDAGGDALWLTTYSHLSWNRPYYERNGFVVVAPEHCGRELNDELLHERRWLPRPEERVIMRGDLVAHPLL